MMRAAAASSGGSGPRDLRGELEPLWQAMARLPRSDGGRAVQFLASHPSAGTSSIAASFALMVAARSRGYAWLVDHDLGSNPLFAAFAAGFADDCGLPGQAYDGSLGVSPVYELTGGDKAADRPERKLLAVHQVEATRLMVTRLRTGRLRPGEAARFVSRADWWAALKRAADWAVADAPALSVSDAGLEVARDMDGTVLVVAADEARPSDVLALRDLVEGQGGLVLGVVVNRLAGDALFFDRMAGA